MVKSWWFLRRAYIARGYPEGHLLAAVKVDSLIQPVTVKKNVSHPSRKGEKYITHNVWRAGKYLK